VAAGGIYSLLSLLFRCVWCDGWLCVVFCRMRVALACALFNSPDLLMLDEPTNHLDLQAVLWLQQYLETYVGTVIVVSHDRAFLDAVATDIIHFHLKRLDYYPGNFSAFQQQREEKQKKIGAIQVGGEPCVGSICHTRFLCSQVSCAVRCDAVLRVCGRPASIRSASTFKSQ
jgi:energy-coupling factor transporter ATP-binding protein EcfA2